MKWLPTTTGQLRIQCKSSKIPASTIMRPRWSLNRSTSDIHLQNYDIYTIICPQLSTFSYMVQQTTLSYIFNQICYTFSETFIKRLNQNDQDIRQVYKNIKMRSSFIQNPSNVHLYLFLLDTQFFQYIYVFAGKTSLFIGQNSNKTAVLNIPSQLSSLSQLQSISSSLSTSIKKKQIYLIMQQQQQSKQCAHQFHNSTNQNQNIPHIQHQFSQLTEILQIALSRDRAYPNSIYRMGGTSRQQRQIIVKLEVNFIFFQGIKFMDKIEKLQMFMLQIINKQTVKLINGQQHVDDNIFWKIYNNAYQVRQDYIQKSNNSFPSTIINKKCRFYGIHLDKIYPKQQPNYLKIQKYPTFQQLNSYHKSQQNTPQYSIGLISDTILIKAQKQSFCLCLDKYV